MKRLSLVSASGLIMSLFMLGCNKPATTDTTQAADSTAEVKKQPISQPLISAIYTADPSAHVFNNRIYIYPSHDVETGTPENDNGDHFNMMDYNILSMDSIGGAVTDHGIGLDIKNIPWAGRQLWAPDAAFANNTYYLYFPVKDKKDVFRIGVATSSKPEGAFTAEKEPIAGSYSIDPCVFTDTDGKSYMYFGGIWGGQLQRWNNNQYDEKAALRKKEEPAILPRVAMLSSDMKKFTGAVKEVQLVDSAGKAFTEGDNSKRFFEAAWMHRFNGKYYLSYSTGDTHFICYAIGDNPYGPFTYTGVVLNPVQGWTNHHSIVEVNGQWYIFYHDVQLSGKTHLRNVKVTSLQHNGDGTIKTIEPYQ
jgi:hypothetical protein